MLVGARNRRVPRPKTLERLRAATSLRVHPRSDEADRRLRLDVDGLVAVDGVGDDRAVEALRVGAGESRVAVRRPLHRRPDAVPVAEVDVVAHADLVAVVDDRRPREGEQQAVEELDPGPVVLEQRRQPSPDADVELHPGVLRVGVVHEVPLGIRAHLERQLVVVPEEEAPLAGLGDRRRVQEHVGDGPAVPAEDGHVHARHQREVKGHVELVAVPEVGADVPRPLVGLGQEDAAAVLGVQARRGGASGRRGSPGGSRSSSPRARRGRGPRRSGTRRGPCRARSAWRPAWPSGPPGCRSSGPAGG